MGLVGEEERLIRRVVAPRAVSEARSVAYTTRDVCLADPRCRVRSRCVRQERRERDHVAPTEGHGHTAVRTGLTDQVPASYIISPAEVPSIKAYPQRLLATALISLGMFVFSILFFAIYDSMGNIRQLIKD